MQISEKKTYKMGQQQRRRENWKKSERFQRYIEWNYSSFIVDGKKKCDQFHKIHPMNHAHSTLFSEQRTV